MATCKNLSLRASGEISSSHFLFWDPLHISETNKARKLKFGTLVGIYEYYRAVYKNLSARWCLGRSTAPYFFML